MNQGQKEIAEVMEQCVHYQKDNPHKISFFEPHTFSLSNTTTAKCSHCSKRFKVRNATVYFLGGMTDTYSSSDEAEAAVISLCPVCGTRVTVRVKGKKNASKKHGLFIFIVILLLASALAFLIYSKGVFPKEVTEENRDAIQTLQKTIEPTEQWETIPIVSMAASSTLEEEGWSYVVENLTDNDLSTCWSFDGNSQESVTYELEEETQISGIALCNGYGLDDTRYDNNNRVTGLRLLFGDGTFEDVQIDAETAREDYESNQLTILPLQNGHTASRVEIVVTETVQGEKFNDTCISEMHLLCYAPASEAGDTANEVSADEIEGATENVTVTEENTEDQEYITLPGGGTAPVDDFIFPYSSSVLLSEQEINDMFQNMGSDDAKSQSQLAINEIYARYGYNFHPEKGTTALQAYNYFNSLDWYKQISAGKDWSNTGEVPVSDIEYQNVQLIAQWQKNNGLR